MSGGAELMERTAGVGLPDDDIWICCDQSRLCGESKFRELEDEFLQKQARIWLSEVLKRRLDDDLSISDMLANGDLLFEVSNILWKMLIEKGVKVDNLKMFTRITKSKKHGGKYMPYSNVDAFLKICKIMGLTGVDLFSPSDVVERRDTRKVCMCLRFLSKKARSMDIKVPDFDIVTYTVIMPTNLIGCIRRSLELSQCGSVSSDSCNYLNDSYLPSMKNNSVASLSKSYDYSEESDDAESNVSVGSYKPSTKTPFDKALLTKSDSLTSIESFSLSKNNNLEEALVDFGVFDHNTDNYVKHQFISSVSDDSSECVIDLPAVSCFSNQMKSADGGCDSTVPADDRPELRVCPSKIEEFLNGSTIRETGTNKSLPVSDSGCHGYHSFCSEKDKECEDMLSQGPKSSKMFDEGELCYNEAHSGNSSNLHTNMLHYDIDDGQDSVESQFGTVLNPPNPVHKSGKVGSYSSDMVPELVTNSDRSEFKMTGDEADFLNSCMDFQSYATDSQDTEESDCNGPSPSQVDSSCGHGEANLLYELKDWSAENEDLENMHMSIIERFLSTTTCSNSEPYIYNEKWDESNCWNLDGDSNGYGLKSVLPINSYEQYQRFLSDCSGDNFLEVCTLVSAVEDKGIIRFDNDRHQTNCGEGTKQMTYETGSLCEQETCDTMPIQNSALDREFYGAKRPITHTVDKLKTNQGEEECSGVKLAETEHMILKDHEVLKSNQSKTRKSPILKSIMGGAALIGMLAFFLSTRASEKGKTNKPGSEPPHLPGGKSDFSSHKANNAVTKKGVYAAEKLKFS